jgi:hypothetical protein
MKTTMAITDMTAITTITSPVTTCVYRLENE